MASQTPSLNFQSTCDGQTSQCSWVVMNLTAPGAGTASNPGPPISERLWKWTTSGRIDLSRSRIADSLNAGRPVWWVAKGESGPNRLDSGWIVTPGGAS